MDGNEAAASVAFRLSEVIAIYPITPASPMGELSDEWAAKQQRNVWGATPTVVEMQSEGGAAGAIHGAIQAGALGTTFTASQGLLLMIPNLYKIAGELTPFVVHVAARTLATHALSIFGDHSDVMACRQIGLAMLSASTVQEAHDFAAIAHAATLRARVPFLHFFDGFRTSHELTRIAPLSDDDLRALVDEDLVRAHRARALTPDQPVIRGTAQNPDVFFQAREASNPFYDRTPDIVASTMHRFAELTGRAYQPFAYEGDPNAERLVVVMGSGSQTVRRVVSVLVASGERVGVVTVHLYRPFDAKRMLDVVPRTVRRVAVLDRTKEPGSPGEPLFLDVVAAFAEGWEGALPLIANGRYGLSSKEFTPAMAGAVFANLEAANPKRRFTVGIVDDVTHLSLPPVRLPAPVFGPDVHQALFYGLGSDGTVGANKNTIKIVGTETDLEVQGYFVYDSKKSGTMTVSHLRFGREPLNVPFHVEEADFVGCHQWEFVEHVDLLRCIKRGGTLLLDSPFSPEESWRQLPLELAQEVIGKCVRLYVVDAGKIARELGLGRRTNTIMQAAYFAITKVIGHEQAIASIKRAIEHSYERKGAEIVRRNLAAVDRAIAEVKQVEIPTAAAGHRPRPPVVSPRAPDFVQRVTAVMLAGQGDLLPVSAFPVDGTWPTGTAAWEKRNIAVEIPIWDPKICIQCNKCTLACPHATIRAKVYDGDALDAAPDGFKSTLWKAEPFKGKSYTIQVAPEDCTGCRLCVEVCPAKDKSNPRHKALDMAPQRPLRDSERNCYAFFCDLPELDRTLIRPDVKNVQLLPPLFEYSGACAGCGETPYIKLMTQLFGDRALVANATGCSSIYGGNLPTTPYTKDRNGRGPSWSNSLFEDNAEFGLGFRLAVDAHSEHAKDLLRRLEGRLGSALVDEVLAALQQDERGIEAQRTRVAELKTRLATLGGSEARELAQIADYLVRKSVWIVGGDGWAYDIGYGGLDHVLASGHDVNLLVLDTEVYSNTGGQASKATPIGASAKFAMAGKATGKKDLAMLAMCYGNIYVARVAFGAKDAQTLRAFEEADSYRGPSLIIAYSPCIAHGYDLAQGAHQQRLAMESGAWPLLRFDPRRVHAGEPPLLLDSGPPTRSLREYMTNETRFRMVEKMDPKRFERLAHFAERHAERRAETYEQLAKLVVSAHGGTQPGATTSAEAE